MIYVPLTSEFGVAGTMGLAAALVVWLPAAEDSAATAAMALGNILAAVVMAEAPPGRESP